MLDVTARSFRGRVCGLTCGDSSLTTPAVVPCTDGEYDEPVYIRLTDSGRVLSYFGGEVPLDPRLKTTQTSGAACAPSVHGQVAVVRLPLPPVIDLPDEVECVVLADAFELRGNPRLLVDTVIALRFAIGANRALMLPGLAEPSTLALLAYMGADIFDDSLCRVTGQAGLRSMPEGIAVEGVDVTGENIADLRSECGKVIRFIRGGRLRELVDQRTASSPSSVAALRVFDRVGYAYQEEAADTCGGRFCCNTTQSLRRPDVLRYRERILTEYRKPAHKRILVLLPCSAKKPYHTSKTHRRFASAIHFSDIETVVHEVIVTSPLGAVPRELDIFYPARSYDIPVTGEWKCQEREFIRELVSHIVSQGYDRVISHLGEDTDLIRGICDMEETVVGDPTSPASLRNLEDAIRRAAEGMEAGDYMTDRKETVRAAMTFQFGRGVADAIMDGDTFAVGKFPYWKVNRGKRQLCMMSEERGGFSLTMDGASILAEAGTHTVNMTDFELKGNLFAVGVLSADPSIRIGEEAVVLRDGKPVAVGVAMMSGMEMQQLRRGIAVKIRHKLK